MKINLNKERYCYHCHKILDKYLFQGNSFLPFKVAKKCIPCQASEKKGSRR